MTGDSNNRTYVSDTTPLDISRALVTYINTAPADILPDKCKYEYLTETGGVTIALTQLPYVTRRYINGGYQAQYDLDVIYRTIPKTDSGRIAADEALDRLAAWICGNVASLDVSDVTIKRIVKTNIPALIDRYDNGAEDHSVSISITYEHI